MQHERVFFLAFQGVQQLCVTGSTQSRDYQGLGFTTGEQRRTVSLRQNADFDVQRTHGAGVATVDTWLAVNDVFANGAVFDFTEGCFDFAGRRLAFFAGQLGNDLVLQLAQACVTVGLDSDGVGVGDSSAELGADSAQQCGGFWLRSPGPGWLGSFGGQFFNGVDHHLELVVSKQYGAQHLVFGQLFGFRFNHQYGFRSTGNNHVQARSGQLLVSRVQQVTGAFVVSNAGSADRTIKRDAGNGQGSRSTDHRSDVRIGFLAGGQNGADNLHFVHEAFWEQRTDRTVDQSRRQGFFLGRATFTLEETARDFTRGVGFFLVVNRQREETLAWIRLLGTDHSHQHADVVVNGDQYCAGSLTGDTASLESNGRLTELKFFDNRVHGVLPSLWLLGNGFLAKVICNIGYWPDSRCLRKQPYRQAFVRIRVVQIKLEAGSLP